MSVKTKTLTINLADVGLSPLGGDSTVAGAEVSVCYDRPVSVDGKVIPRFPAVLDATGGGWSCQVVANDDPAITSGAGFLTEVRARLSPRRGLHATEIDMPRRIVVASSDPDVVPLASKQEPFTLPSYVDPASLSGIAWWTDPQTGDRVPILVAPSDGTLTTLGGSNAR